ncbi:GntR family transcriptional regulator [Roseinatronobacter thiooxidans]|uniref:GntR family transcriptional regulator n=2 Tax=Roseinatronobacter thiooxidans TaxID=121821 RepID=A0A2W7PNU0_9RHOB|nr:GntR family transcriptional regulator [Roseinatronobacter thiooxidans]PZX37216.1 GntR family transcriptional regulator [Roseinatronobacter thiooxidans]
MSSPVSGPETITQLQGGTSQSTVESVYSALKADIISGRRKPGEFLRIDRMSRVYGVGPTPLRETLQRLTAENLVIARGGRGFQVAPLTIDEFVDLNIARTAIETAALRLSIKHGAEDWESRVVAAGYILKKWDAAMLAGEADNLSRWENANAEFHSALLSGCPSLWLLHAQQGFANKCDRYRRAAVVGAGTPYRADVEREHGEILNAVLQRDADRGCELLATHYQRTVDAFRLVVESGLIDTGVD